VAELRQHRNVSEIIFGLVMKGDINPGDVEGEMLIYPYNAAIEDMPEPNHATLSGRYGSEAINAAMAAAETTNGIAPELYLRELARVYRDFKIVNVMHRATRGIQKNEEVDFASIKSEIDKRIDDIHLDPISWEDIKDEFNQEWLWSGWIPHAAVTFLVGQQGAGKSAFALYFADCVANGAELPDGSYVGETRGVLWVETEGRHAENIRRARLWGIRSRNIYSPSHDLRRVLDLSNAQDKALIRAHAMRDEVGLVVIDSLGGALVNENESQAKQLAQSLSIMAQETDTTFIIIHHLRKPPTQGVKGQYKITLADVRGHSGITQFAPSVIAIDYDGFEGPRNVSLLKMNLVKAPTSIFFTMGMMGLDWGRSGGSQVNRAIVGEVVTWLEDMLSAGPVLLEKVKEAAEKEGYDLKVLKRAMNQQSIHVKDQGGERYVSI